MSDKENCDFSSAVLLLASVVYCLVLSISMCVLISTRPETATALESFVFFVKDYGSAIAGIPVILGIFVAREQLNANRKQHHSLILLNLLPYNQTFYEVISRARTIIGDIDNIDNENNFEITPLRKDVIPGWSIYLSPYIAEMIYSMERNYFKAEKINATSANPDDATPYYEMSRRFAVLIVDSILARQRAVMNLAP